MRRIDYCEIIFHGSSLGYGDIYLLDPCPLLVCKLNAFHTRPPGESENDKVHAKILSLIIPRFLSKHLRHQREKGDPYHPGADAPHLLSFLQKDPWGNLLPPEQKMPRLKPAPGSGSRASRKSR